MLVANAVLTSMLVAGAQAGGTPAAAHSADGAAPAVQDVAAGAASAAAAAQGASTAPAGGVPSGQGTPPASAAAVSAPAAQGTHGSSRAASAATPAADAADATADAGAAPRFSVEVGESFVGSTAALGMGLSARLLTRGESLLVSQSIDRLVGGRTIGLLGFGAEHRTARGWSVLALGVGGFDAADGAALGIRPAAGARVGVEWPVRYRFVQMLDVSVTGTADLTRGRDSLGNRPPLVTTWLTMSAGFGFSPGPR